MHAFFVGCRFFLKLNFKKNLSGISKVSHMFSDQASHFVRPYQGFSYLSEGGATGLLNLGNHQNWENLLQSKKTGQPF